jgi:hypothetical protein
MFMNVENNEFFNALTCIPTKDGSSVFEVENIYNGTKAIINNDVYFVEEDQ